MQLHHALFSYTLIFWLENTLFGAALSCECLSIQSLGTCSTPQSLNRGEDACHLEVRNTHLLDKKVRPLHLTEDVIGNPHVLRNRAIKKLLAALGSLISAQGNNDCLYSINYHVQLQCGRRALAAHTAQKRSMAFDSG